MSEERPAIDCDHGFVCLTGNQPPCPHFQGGRCIKAQPPPMGTLEYPKPWHRDLSIGEDIIIKGFKLIIRSWKISRGTLKLQDFNMQSHPNDIKVGDIVSFKRLIFKVHKWSSQGMLTLKLQRNVRVRINVSEPQGGGQP